MEIQIHEDRQIERWREKEGIDGVGRGSEMEEWREKERIEGRERGGMDEKREGREKGRK